MMILFAAIIVMCHALWVERPSPTSIPTDAATHQQTFMSQTEESTVSIVPFAWIAVFVAFFTLVAIFGGRTELDDQVDSVGAIAVLWPALLLASLRITKAGDIRTDSAPDASTSAEPIESMA